jgi:hypothetical protein
MQVAGALSNAIYFLGVALAGLLGCMQTTDGISLSLLHINITNLIHTPTAS